MQFTLKRLHKDLLIIKSFFIILIIEKKNNKYIIEVKNLGGDVLEIIHKTSKVPLLRYIRELVNSYYS